MYTQSCGYAVPYYDFRGHRNALLDYFDKRELARAPRMRAGVRAEAAAYMLVAAAPARARAHLMELHGILQDGARVLFVMVRARFPSVCAFSRSGRRR